MGGAATTGGIRPGGSAAETAVSYLKPPVPRQSRASRRKIREARRQQLRYQRSGGLQLHNYLGQLYRIGSLSILSTHEKQFSNLCRREGFHHCRRYRDASKQSANKD